MQRGRKGERERGKRERKRKGKRQGGRKREGEWERGREGEMGGYFPVTACPKIFISLIQQLFTSNKIFIISEQKVLQLIV